MAGPDSGCSSLCFTSNCNTTLNCCTIVCCVGHFKLLLEGSIHSVLPMGHSRYVYRVNKSENINLSTSSIFFLLLTSSNYCRSTHYLWLQPLFWNSYWGMSHRRVMWVQPYILPTVPLEPGCLPVIIYLNFISIYLSAWCKIPSGYRAPHHSRIKEMISLLTRCKHINGSKERCLLHNIRTKYDMHVVFCPNHFNFFYSFKKNLLCVSILF